MIKFVICEDEPSCLTWIQTAVTDWGVQRNETLQLFCYASAEELLFKSEEWLEADGLILDIELKQMNGMELARHIRQQDAHISILFATGYEQFVFEGYEVGAVSYLMKPIQPGKLYAALDRIRAESEKRQDVLLTNTGEENTRLYLDDIFAIESSGHYSLLHTRSGTIEARRSLGSFQEELAKKPFCSPHRSYLVHIGHISRILKKSLFLDNGMELPIARGKWEETNQAYLRYYRNRI